MTGRIFFEEVIRENLDIGRPSQVSLVFDRKVSRRTPGRFRTRVITDGVVPSLHVDYKKTRIKQYHKEGQALRTETTINDTRDFAIGRRIENLPELRKIGFAANRRLLDVQRIGHDCFIGEAIFQDLQRPITVNDQRAAALRFADPRVQALLHVLLLFLLVQGTFTHKDVREHLAPLLGKKPSQLTPGRITYDLRRLRLHGLTERIPKTHRYRITPKGLRTAIFYTGSITAHCAPAWPSSRHARSIPSYQSPNPSAPRKPPSTHGTNMKNSQHENLTQLHQKAVNDSGTVRSISITSH